MRRSPQSTAFGRHDLVVNLQGDLPTLDPAAIGAVLEPLSDPEVDIATIAAAIREETSGPTPMW